MAGSNLMRLFSSNNPYRVYFLFCLFGLFMTVLLGAVFLDRSIIMLVVPPSLIYFWIDLSEGKRIQKEVDRAYKVCPCLISSNHPM